MHSEDVGGVILVSVYVMRREEGSSLRQGKRGKKRRLESCF